MRGKPLKLLMVYGAPILGRTGGHEYVVKSLSEGVVNENCAVKIVCPNQSNHFVVEQRNNVQYLLLPSFSLHNRARFFKPAFLRELIRAINRVDAVHAHCPDNPFAFLIGLLSKLIGKPVVFTILAYADDLKRQELMFSLLGIVTVIEQTIAARVCDKIHVESLYDQSKLHFFSKKTVLIPPGIGDEIIYDVSDARLRKKLEEKIKANDSKVVLYLGRVQRVKGLDHAVRAVALLREQAVKVKLVIAGPDDGYIPELMEKYRFEFEQGTFTYLGRVSKDEKLALLDLSSVLVLPSITDVVEAYSIVASEAWARKKPVVCYAVGALKYRVKDSVNGYAAKPLDTLDLSKKLLMALNFSKPLKVPSDIIDWKTASQEFKRLYDSLVDQNQGS